MMEREDILDLFAKEQPKSKKHIYTVSELTSQIKEILEQSFTQVWVEGEISGISRISTGTVFFSIKDNASLLKCVMFPSYGNSVKFELKDGLKVICFGHISLYEKSGQYQLYIERIEPKGIGSLQLAFEQLKEKLEKEGLFSPEHKRPLPYLPSKIGIVTSITGAAIKDMLKVLDRRFKDVHILIRPALVQGEAAKEDIAEAIRDLNVYSKQLPESEQIEVIIVGRGGGSIEDLWAFNEEIVARAIYNSDIPVISAVGHERDYTISDMVADLRAATPSVAAEIVLPRKEDLKTQTQDLLERMRIVVGDKIGDYLESFKDVLHRLQLNMVHICQLNQHRLESVAAKLARVNPVIVIPELKMKIEDLAKQIQVRMKHLLERKKMDFSVLVEKLSSLNPLNILSRGYSVTFKIEDDAIVKNASSLAVGDQIKTRVFKGEFVSKVTLINKVDKEAENAGS